MSHATRIIAGAMSGTSTDGVDVALVRIDGRGLAMRAELIRHHHRAYDAALRCEILESRAAAAIGLDSLCHMGRLISLTYAAAVNEALVAAGLCADDLACVAAHGQTLFHDPPDTLQWLDPALLAAETGCAVVSDFRRADCAAGGQGAPLVPFADWLLFRHESLTRVCLNIGGIANLTYLPAGGSLDDVIAFDTGPGNCISDWLCRTSAPDGPGYDVGGQRAMRQRPVDRIVEALLANDCFARRPPKSTDGPAMIQAWKEAHSSLSAQAETPPCGPDLLATAAEVTARSIARAVADFLPRPPDQVIVSGGGTHNGAIMARLRDLLPVEHLRTDDLGIPSAAKEAVAFALLGAATLDGEPANVPSATGARRRVVLGAVTPRP